MTQSPSANGPYLNATVLSTLVQPDGKLVLAGYMSRADGRPSVGVVARFLPDGALDPSFGDGGLTRLRFAAEETSEYVFAIARDPLGRILFVHLCCGPSIGRLTADGRLDTTFGDGGRIGFCRAAPGAVVTLVSLAATPDGGALAGGATDHRAVVVRVTSGGTLDRDWGEAGVGTFPAGAGTPVALALTPGGGVAVAGVSSPNGWEHAFWAARMDATGRPDASFGSPGGVSTLLGTGDSSNGRDAHVRATAVQADGKVLVAGSARFKAPGMWRRRGTIVRYRPDGSLDPGLADGGVAILPYDGENSTEFYGLGLQPDGRIVAAGLPDMSVTRYRAPLKKRSHARPGAILR